MKYALWVVQALLAALFLFPGGIKLVLPIEAMTQQLPMPGWFLRFVGVCEIRGALGLILPGVFRIGLVLTPLAACGLAVIMIGADATTGSCPKGRSLHHYGTACAGTDPAARRRPLGFVIYNRRSALRAQ